MTSEPFEYFSKKKVCFQKIKDILTTEYQHLGGLAKCMQVYRLGDGPLFGRCDTLGGGEDTVKSAISLFWHICDGLKVSSFYLSDQELVNRCSLGCLTWPILDFWTYD